jgi:hypothetical protein
MTADTAAPRRFVWPPEEAWAVAGQVPEMEDLYRTCPCGNSGANFWPGPDSAKHARVHLRWAQGLPLPKTVHWGDGVVAIPAGGRIPEGKVAYELARLGTAEPLSAD